ncbi:MAG: tyrosine decarboxylase MfnA [Promethearchaeota archaeon]|nr:MAG: tyrosine decarboxylase MfnA [Candidatus Lokiarchaeota archaeon]
MKDILKENYVMLKQGLKKHDILKIIDNKLEIDHAYNDGTILGSMCTEPLKFGRQVYLKYLSKNLGDPGLFPGTAKLEKEVISELGELFGGKNVIGALTTGGSEANLIAMRIAKKLHPEIKNPEVVVPLSAHISFDKAADLLSIKLRKARLLENFEVDLNHYKDLINENTCGVVGIAGTTSLGLIDPIEKIGDFIKEKDIFFHVDAAFGGFVLPFLKYLNYDIKRWDFSVKEVDSLTADPHKMGLGLIPTGGFFVRNSQILQKTGFEIPYLAGGNFKHFHIVGTRSGGTVVSFWAIMKYLGLDGFVNVVKRCMENTRFLVDRIKEIKGIKLAAQPTMNVVGITTEDGESICKIDEELRKRKWMLGKFKDFNLIRIVVMPHVKKKDLTHFIEDLKEILKNLQIA